jgi:hypothetical protein
MEKPDCSLLTESLGSESLRGARHFLVWLFEMGCRASTTMINNDGMVAEIGRRKSRSRIGDRGQNCSSVNIMYLKWYMYECSLNIQHPASSFSVEGHL